MLVRFFVNLTQARVVWEEGTSTEKLSVGLACRHVYDLCGRAQSIVRGFTSGHMVHGIRSWLTKAVNSNSVLP